MEEEGIKALIIEVDKLVNNYKNLFSVRYNVVKPEDAWYDRELEAYYKIKVRIEILTELILDKGE